MSENKNNIIPHFWIESCVDRGWIKLVYVLALYNIEHGNKTLPLTQLNRLLGLSVYVDRWFPRDKL